MASATPKTISAKPEAELVPRRGDEVLNWDELSLLDLFGNLKKKISVEKFPGSIVLRRFRLGEIICRQGERGHTAFYIARAEDIRKLREFQSQPRQSDSAANPSTAPDAAPNNDSLASQKVATAYLFSARPVTVRSGIVGRLFGWRPRPSADVKPEYIPNDGPTDIDYHTRQAPMFEGDVFGEMSCMTLAPRSATVVADQDCYMVEFQRNIFDQMQKDAGYRARIDSLYEQRVLTNHLRRLELFRDLDDTALATLQKAAHLEVVDPGVVICDEGDPADAAYIIRSGVVQVVHGAHVAFQVSDVTDWKRLCQALLKGAGVDAAASDSSPLPASAPAAKPTGGKLSAKEMLAAERAKKAAAQPPAAVPNQAETKPPEPANAETPAAKPRPTPGKATDILAAERAAKRKTAAPAQGDSVASPPTTTAAESSAPAAGPAITSDTPVLAAAAPAASGDPRKAVWAWLLPPVQAAIQSVASAEVPRSTDQEFIIRALNQLMRRRDFIASADLASTLEHADVVETARSFPRGLSGAKNAWSDLDVRMAAALVWQALYPGTFAAGRWKTGPLTILDYMARGDCFGEMGVVLDQRRGATCIAYDHPSDDPSRKPGRVELVRIDAAVFRQLANDFPQIHSAVANLIAARRKNIARSEQRQPWDAERMLSETQEFRDQGLIQGQSLLLIDLDHCTRCGDCVRACVNTHNDGYSRLFLDGPRFDRFLVPSACRQCLNPACMIGCPVGSIQRGDNGQIEIRDWCIGCGLCARQCPYDSIQMHDVGLLPENSAGWQFAPLSAVAAKRWQRRLFRPRRWHVGAAPFRWTLDLVEQLAAAAKAGAGWQPTQGTFPEPICFRQRFEVTRDQLDHDHFRLHLISEDCAVEVWLNGRAVELQQDAKQKKNGEFEARLERAKLRRGGNVLAVLATPPQPGDAGAYVPAYNQRLLAARIDPIPRAGELTALTAGTANLEVELVTEQPVVCDLCSSLPSQQPACVTHCPHDAAIRVNTRLEFLA